MSALLRRIVWCGAVSFGLVACGGGGSGTPDARVADAGPDAQARDAKLPPPVSDASRVPDAALPAPDGAVSVPDAALPMADARLAPDAAALPDAATPDARVVTPDAALPDAMASPDAAALPDAAPPPEDRTERVFDLTMLHHVDITVAEADMPALESDRENRVPCDIVYDNKELPHSGIRQKGGIGSVSSLNGKPGFSLKFNEFEVGQDLHGLEKLILNNAIQDGTFLHEHIGYALSNRLGIPAARTAHAVVTLNGYTYGIYVVMEATDGDFLRRHFGQDQDGGNLYEGPCCADFVNDIAHMDLKDEADGTGRTRDDLTALANAVRDTPDDMFAETVGGLLDLRNFILSYALDAVLVHWDGYAYNVNNHYIYHRPSDGRFVFMPHGMDQVLGNADFDPFAGPVGILAQRVRAIPALDAQFRAAVEHIAVDEWDVDVVRRQADGVRRVLAQAPLEEPNVARDVRSFQNNVAGVVSEFARRKGVLLRGVAPQVCTAESLDGANFSICTESLTAPDARSRCAALGGALAVPRSDAEQAFIAQTSVADGAVDAWIGADDEALEGVFRDPDGVVLAYTAWGVDRPNGAQDQNCVMLDSGLEGGWNDRACTELHGFVCRVP